MRSVRQSYFYNCEKDVVYGVGSSGARKYYCMLYSIFSENHWKVNVGNKNENEMVCSNSLFFCYFEIEGKM